MNQEIPLSLARAGLLKTHISFDQIAIFVTIHMPALDTSLKIFTWILKRVPALKRVLVHLDFINQNLNFPNFHKSPAGRSRLGGRDDKFMVKIIRKIQGKLSVLGNDKPPKFFCKALPFL